MLLIIPTVAIHLLFNKRHQPDFNFTTTFVSNFFTITQKVPAARQT